LIYILGLHQKKIKSHMTKVPLKINY